MLKIHLIPEGEVGCAVGQNGNPEVLGFDRSSQTLVAIEFTPEAWKAFLRNAQRLRGVGIAPANMADVLELGGKAPNGG